MLRYLCIDKLGRIGFVFLVYVSVLYDCWMLLYVVDGCCYCMLLLLLVVAMLPFRLYVCKEDSHFNIYHLSLFNCCIIILKTWTHCDPIQYQRKHASPSPFDVCEQLIRINNLSGMDAHGMCHVNRTLFTKIPAPFAHLCWQIPTPFVYLCQQIFTLTRRRRGKRRRKMLKK